MATTDKAANESRRRVISAGLGAVAGLAASSLGRPAGTLAANGDPLELGASDNAASGTTALLTTTGDGLSVTTADIAGRGIKGVASSEAGSTYGVWGETASVTGRGVYGVATAEYGTTFGVWGETLTSSGAGVFGRAVSWAGDHAGVFGEATAPNGYGVRGRCTANNGFQVGGLFEINSPNGTAVHAKAPGSAVGLRVDGRVVLNRANKVKIKAGTRSVRVNLAGITASTLVVATIQGYRPGYHVASVYPQPGYFRIYLNKVATRNVTVGYVVVN